ncbi:hypothetical protein ScPMuIL_007078 [Solemya velum]
MADMEETDPEWSEFGHDVQSVQQPSSSCEDERVRKKGRLKDDKNMLKDDKLCRVCGDKALGYNFNAITCESCKAFFRRNALKDQKTSCLFDGNCPIDVRTRRFCPHCRLKRCFDIGMKKDMILDETERRARMAKVLQNRQKRGSKQVFDIKSEPLEIDTEMPDQSSESFPSLSSSSLQPISSWAIPLSPTTKGIKPVEDLTLPTDPDLYRTLSTEDQAVMSELTEIYQSTLGEVITDKKVTDENGYENVNDLVNNSEIAVRRLISFVKKLNDFRLLCQADQIAALKACILNTLLLRSVTFYHVEKDAWITPTGVIPTSILKSATGFIELHDSHTKYCRSLKAVVKDDLHIMAMLQAIVIFNPDGQNIISRSTVSDIQDKYIILLKHYMESIWTFEYARDYYPFVLQKIAELKGLSEEHASVLLQVNPNKIEPLMLEVLNLK